ncbi:Rad52/Rad22 family DNA repair protein [Rubrivirga sp. IMCC45206]|uniref:Rad52/Rad22 family DNA repair protein n=1 Tax=Rubrivirga sp. IMCC45206 TaxID=3391614 RepID=UPI00398FD7A9
MKASELRRLAAPFPPADVEWKPGATTRDKSKGLAMAYLTSRAVQQRFDDVCGPADWRNEFREGPGGGVLCGISVRVERDDGTAEWVTKWDGADNSAVEAVKGGLSGATKRAAVQWGVGRYLYELPATWVRLDERGRFAETPQIPRAFLPRPEPSRSESQPSRPAPPPRSEGRPQPPRSAPPPRSQGRPQRDDERRQRPQGGRPGPSGRPGPQVRRPSSGDGDGRPVDPGF